MFISVQNEIDCQDHVIDPEETKNFKWRAKIGQHIVHRRSLRGAWRPRDLQKAGDDRTDNAKPLEHCCSLPVECEDGHTPQAETRVVRRVYTV